MAQYTHGDETITPTTLAATTWTKIADAVKPGENVQKRELWNESGAAIRFIYNDTAPTLATEGRELADEAAYIADRSTGISVSALYAYSTPGGVVQYVQG